MRLGYLSTVAVAGQIWTGVDQGSFDRQGIEFEMVRFNTGLEMFEALTEGGLDVLATGAVLSNGPARGRGKVFLVNNIEVATAQLWVRGDQGLASITDLKGRRVTTAVGTTAHLFLDRALRANKLDPRDVEIVDRSMPAAVAAFVAGEVPAVALWVPHNVVVRSKMPGAVKIADASAFYPQAAVMGGWAARNDYYVDNKDVLCRIAKGWAEANDYIIANPDLALTALATAHHPDVPIADIQEQFKAQKMFTSKEWKRFYVDGTVANWLQQSSDFFVASACIPGPVKATDYFDPKIYLGSV